MCYRPIYSRRQSRVSSTASTTGFVRANWVLSRCHFPRSATPPINQSQDRIPASPKVPESPDSLAEDPA
ncbi:hypothetical protein M8J76_005481 [Diaphorina citri]|nr:hypothetical protein M8J76_005481 [Diaphorina citri]